MAGAVGIVFGLCVLSFTSGAALMYVVLRRREDSRAPSASRADEPVERTWVEKPATVEPVDDEYDSRPIHRNPVVGLPQLEPALAVPVEPGMEVEPGFVAEPELIAEPLPAAEPEPEPADESEAERVQGSELERVQASEPEPADESETVGADGYDRDGDLEPPLGESEAPESTVAVSTDSPELPPPAAPQQVEHTTWVEREDFRQRYLRTFEEVRRKAGNYGD